MGQGRTTIAAICIAGLSFGCGPDSQASDADPNGMSSTSAAIIGGYGDSVDVATAALFLSPGNKLCTGSLIGPQTVLTAAHCVVGESSASVRFCQHPRLCQPGEFVTTTAQVIVNPSFDGNIWHGHDEGILILSAPAPYTPLLPNLGAAGPNISEPVHMVGYGADIAGSSPSGAGPRRAVDGAINIVSPFMLNAGTATQGICEGDSGGPTLNGNHILGVHSVGTSDNGTCLNAAANDSRVDVDARWICQYVPPVAVTQQNGCGIVTAGHGLQSGTSVTSCDGRFTFAMQADQNLVLYQKGVGPIWWTGTNGLPGTSSLVMQGDGNLVAYTCGGHAIWSSGTAGNPGAFLAVQNDGNVVVYTSSGRWIWQSHTCCR